MTGEAPEWKGHKVRLVAAVRESDKTLHMFQGNVTFYGTIKEAWLRSAGFRYIVLAYKDQAQAQAKDSGMYAVVDSMNISVGADGEVYIDKPLAIFPDKDAAIMYAVIACE